MLSPNFVQGPLSDGDLFASEVVFRLRCTLSYRAAHGAFIRRLHNAFRARIIVEECEPCDLPAILTRDVYLRATSVHMLLLAWCGEEPTLS